MNQKTINIALFVCLIALSLVCYRQSQQINAMQESISITEDIVNNLDRGLSRLNSTVNDLESEIETLKDEIDPPLYIHSKPISDKSRDQRKQDAIERIQRFNAAREEDQRNGITNSDPKVEDERKSLYLSKKIFNLDIEIK